MSDDQVGSAVPDLDAIEARRSDVREVPWGVNGYLIESSLTDIPALVTHARALRAEVAALRAAVLRYGFHRFECRKIAVDGFQWERDQALESAPCTCGFEDAKRTALAGPTPAPEEA